VTSGCFSFLAFDFRFREVLLGNYKSYLDAAKSYQVILYEMYFATAGSQQSNTQ